MKPKGKKRTGVEGGHLLLPGLDVDTALRCLAFVPSYIYPLLASLNKTYRSLIIAARSAPLMELRRTLGIVDHLLISQHGRSPQDYAAVPIDGEEDYASPHEEEEEEELMQAPKIKQSLRVLDLKRNTWMNLAIPGYVIAWRNYNTFFCSGTRLFCSAYSRADVSIQYDFAINRWEIGRRMREHTRRSCAFAADGDFCFVAGGHKINGYQLLIMDVLSSAEVYSMRRKSWRRKSWRCLPPMPAARDNCVGFIMDKKFYVIGGTDGRSYHFADAVEYDPSTKAWKTVPNMCLNASYPLVAVHKNQLYAIDDKVSTPSNPSLHVYEKQTNTWRCLGPVLGKHDEGNLYMREGGLISMGSDKLLVVGEWRPRVQEDEKKTYVLAWEASLEATVCEFKIVYSGPAEWDFFNGMSELAGEEERRFRQNGKPWLAVAI